MTDTVIDFAGHVFPSGQAQFYDTEYASIMGGVTYETSPAPFSALESNVLKLAQGNARATGFTRAISGSAVYSYYGYHRFNKTAGWPLTNTALIVALNNDTGSHIILKLVDNGSGGGVASDLEIIDATGAVQHTIVPGGPGVRTKTVNREAIPPFVVQRFVPFKM